MDAALFKPYIDEVHEWFENEVEQELRFRR